MPSKPPVSFSSPVRPLAVEEMARPYAPLLAAALSESAQQPPESALYSALAPEAAARIDQFLAAPSAQLLLIHTTVQSVARGLLDERLSAWQTNCTGEAARPFHLEAPLSAGFADLLGGVDTRTEPYTLLEGLLHHQPSATLLLPISVAQPTPETLCALLEALRYQILPWFDLRTKQSLPIGTPAKRLNWRLILMGPLDLLPSTLSIQCSELTVIETWIDPYLTVNQHATRLALWMRYVTQSSGETLFPESWQALLDAALRYYEDPALLPLSKPWITCALADARHQQADLGPLTLDAFNAAEAARYVERSALRKQTLRDMENHTIQIQTSGAVIGQCNGLVVWETPGSEAEIGSPTRISCVVFPGETLVSDVEHKVSLGGSIHAKGTLILEAYLASLLELGQPLPFSASLAFEQSYDLIDGDSASLAGLCTLISALARCPLKQHIALTGAIDQLGHVLAIGGVNAKVEAFFELCEARGLTGAEGVILPKANQPHLVLTPRLREAIEKAEFSIWGVSHVREVLPLMTGYPLDGPPLEPTLLGFIRKRVSELHGQETGWLSRIWQKCFPT